MIAGNPFDRLLAVTGCSDLEEFAHKFEFGSSYVHLNHDLEVVPFYMLCRMSEEGINPDWILYGREPAEYPIHAEEPFTYSRKCALLEVFDSVLQRCNHGDPGRSAILLTLELMRSCPMIQFNNPELLREENCVSE